MSKKNNTILTTDTIKDRVNVDDFDLWDLINQTEEIEPNEYLH